MSGRLDSEPIMKDPTRIPVIVDALQRVWEGQPDLSLAEIWGMLETRGVGWATTDEELLAQLRSLIDAHPAVVRSGELDGKVAIVETQSPRRRVTLDGVDRRVTVRAFGDDILPTTWQGATIRRLASSTPLLLEDSEGIEHRLGVVSSVRIVERPDAIDLGGRTRTSMGDEVYGVLVAAGDDERAELAVVGHAIDVQSVKQRQVETTRLRFSRILSCAVGSGFRVQVQGESGEVSLGLVRAIFPLDI